MRNTKKYFAALAVAGVIAASGSAYTNSMAGLDATDSLGYGSTTVSGATVNSLTYTFNTAKDTITSVAVVLDGDTTAGDLALAFNDAAPASCTEGAYNVTNTETPYTCTVSQSVAGLTETGLFFT